MSSAAARGGAEIAEISPDHRAKTEPQVAAPGPLTSTAPRRTVLHVFPTFGFGGVPIRIANVINRLGADYHHVILSLDGCYDSEVRLDSDSDVVLAPFAVADSGTLGTVRFAIARLRELRPDVLATYNWGSIEWALANSLFVRGHHVHFESGFGPEEANRQIPRRVLMRRLALTGARHLVVPSQVLVRIAADIWRIGESRIRYVPNGVDVDQFARHAATPADMLDKAPGEFVIGTVSPLRREKNIGRLLRAFAEMPPASRPVRLVIAGDGEERADLEALAVRLGIAGRTVFLGHVERVAETLAAFDLFAISSDTEQMPNSLLQAMAAGLPVASVDVGDVGLIVARENYPFIVPRDEPGALSRALAALVGDDRLRTAVAHANFAHVSERYSMDRMLTAYRAIYDGQSPPAS